MVVDVGDRLAAWMTCRRMSPQQIAAEVGVSVAAVYQWIGTGEQKTSPTHENLQSAVAALGITMSQFYGRLPRRRRSA